MTQADRAAAGAGALRRWCRPLCLWNWAENKFATADYVMRYFRGISVHNASGIVQQRAAHDFDRPSNVVSDRRKRKTPSCRRRTG